MGGTYPSHPGTAPLEIFLNPLPPGAQVKLVQYRLMPGRDLSAIVDHQVVDPTQPVMVVAASRASCGSRYGAARTSLLPLAITSPSQAYNAM